MMQITLQFHKHLGLILIYYDGHHLNYLNIIIYEYLTMTNRN